MANVNERFTDLPLVIPQLTDIICAVQGYTSPENIGVSVQETLGSILGLVPALNLNFVTVLTTTEQMTVNTTYRVNSGAGLCTLTLPVVSAVGQVINVIGYSAAGWRISQNADQQIIIGPLGTTVGVGGYIASTNQNDSIQLMCVLANTIWQTMGGPQGCITIA